MKSCSRCGDAKPVEAFYRETKSPDGRTRWCKACMGVASKAYKATPEYRLSYYRRSALTRGLAFTLTIDDFRLMWNAPCTYCGDRIDGIGLDRVHNDEGYHFDNVVPCCTTCNSMKSRMGLMEFTERCSRIAARMSLPVWANAAVAIDLEA